MRQYHRVYWKIQIKLFCISNLNFSTFSLALVSLTEFFHSIILNLQKYLWDPPSDDSSYFFPSSSPSNVAPPFVSPSERSAAFTRYKLQLSCFHSFRSYSLSLCLTEWRNTTGSYWTKRFTTKIENWDGIKGLEFIGSCRRQEHKNTWEKVRYDI